VPTLQLTQDPAADSLLSEDPFALLTGMLLDQQVPMSKALSEGKAPAGGRWTDRRSLGHRPNPLSTFSLRTLDSHRLPSSVQNLGASVA